MSPLIRLTPPRRARRLIAGLVIPWMLSRKIFRWRLAPPFPSPLPPLPRPDIVSSCMNWSYVDVKTKVGLWDRFENLLVYIDNGTISLQCDWLIVINVPGGPERKRVFSSGPIRKLVRKLTFSPERKRESGLENNFNWKIVKLLMLKPVNFCPSLLHELNFGLMK